MLLEGIVAASFLGLGCAIIGADSRLGRTAAYALHQWRRRARARRRAANVPAAERLTR
jgi:hypothetical protein